MFVNKCIPVVHIFHAKKRFGLMLGGWADVFIHKLGPSEMSVHLANNKQVSLGCIEIEFKIKKLLTILERTVLKSGLFYSILIPVPVC